MDEKKETFTSLKDVPETAWKKLAEKRIYFGHQSVGFDLINGIKDLMKENSQIKLNLVETSTPSAFSAPIFAHSKIGKNEGPSTKCVAFGQLMEAGIGANADIALLKYCFVDVTATTDVDALFAEYQKQFSYLRQKYPKLTIVHITVPLRIVQTGIWAAVKRLIGREIGGYSDNMKREQFNQMIRRVYADKERIFDLAMIESTYPDGARSSFTKDGKSYYSLVPEYTHDGGHLNERGRKAAAEHLLVLLANLSV
ncbi:MAG: hypothetical protein AB2L12_00020 [Smithellaceae bacterium]